MRIIHPRPALGRQRALGVEFTDGVATVESLHPERELALRQHGYTIEADLEVETPFQATIGEPIIDLERLTRAELRAMLPEGADVPAKATHKELVDAVSAIPAAPILGSVDNGDGTFTAEGTPFFDLTDEQLRDAAALEGLDVAPDATRQDIIGAFIAAGQESD